MAGAIRRQFDWYGSPGFTVDRLMDEIELPGERWLEPSAGDGSIIRAASARRNIRWTACEIQERFSPALNILCDKVFIGDFLSIGFERFDCVLGNPPYSLSFEFVQKCLSLSDCVVFLLPLSFLASQKRCNFMRSRTPDVYILPNRPSFGFDGGSTNMVDYAFYRWHGEKNRRVGTVRVLNTTPDYGRR